MKPLILIVDDNHDNVNVIEEMLDEHGLDYYGLSDPTKITDVLTFRAADLILLDLYMPQRSGLETLMDLKNDHRFEPIPVIMLTAETDKIMVSQCLDAGAMDYLNKPVDSVELQARIRSALKITSLNKKLSERNTELDNKNKELQKFTGMIVHDLKNPLTVITASVDFVRKALTEANRSDAMIFANMIHDVAFSMGDSIDEMLDVNRIQQGAVELNLVRSNPYGFIEKTLHPLRLIADKKLIKIIHEKTELPVVRYDEKGLESILMNLVGNAIKYSYPHSEIRIHYQPCEGHLKILVTDHGQGLTEQDIQLAFKEFQRLSSTPTQGEPSTGLGLAIVKSIAVAMGSTVGVCSEGKGKGATFWFTLSDT